MTDLLSALCEFSIFNPQVPYNIWVKVFPIAWATLSKEDQLTLVPSVITLLGKTCHIDQFDKRPNVVQAILEAIR